MKAAQDDSSESLELQKTYPSALSVDDEEPTAVQKFLYPDKEELPDDFEMPIWDHLDELRERVLVGALSCTVAILSCFCFSKELVVFLEAPVADAGGSVLWLAQRHATPCHAVWPLHSQARRPALHVLVPHLPASCCAVHTRLFGALSELEIGAPLVWLPPARPLLLTSRAFGRWPKPSCDVFVMFFYALCIRYHVPLLIVPAQFIRSHALRVVWYPHPPAHGQGSLGSLYPIAQLVQPLYATLSLPTDVVGNVS